MKTEIEKVRKVLANQENEDAETIGAAAREMQKASLKLFEMAYKKVKCGKKKIYIYMLSIFCTTRWRSRAEILFCIICDCLWGQNRKKNYGTEYF